MTSILSFYIIDLIPSRYLSSLEERVSDEFIISIYFAFTTFFLIGLSVFLAILIKFKHNKNYKNDEIKT
jgi:O-antigen/teichoic acid export membrane protein